MLLFVDDSRYRNWPDLTTHVYRGYADFPPYKLGAAMGMVGLVIMFAPAVGPTIAGAILGLASWRWIFWLFIPFLIIAFIFAVTSLKNIAKVTRPKVDFLSILLSMVGFGSLVVGVSLASDQGWGSPAVLGALIWDWLFCGMPIDNSPWNRQF